MPKTHPNDSLVFLYMCLLNSDFSTIDWKALGEATNLNLGAARMRYHRLKKNLDAVVKDGKFDLSTTSAASPTKKQGLDMIAADKEGTVESTKSNMAEASPAGISVANSVKDGSPKRKMEEADDSDAETIVHPSFRVLPYVPAFMQPGGYIAPMPAPKKIKED
ncbi:hypothetical protein AbraIFM66950_008127 [Aspergillus brasiliensis]|nr:hypothetical protein AbraIFM66950_008127 [Aspergillus brasiliensis]